MSSVKKICICAFCTALCCVLPVAFHAVGLGAVLSPLHLPVLLCGLLCSWPYGALCGLAGPLLSSLLTSRPAAAQLPYMIPELVAYGLFTGLLMRFVRTGRTVADLYISLLSAMLLGRIVGGAARALFYLGSSESWTLSLWAGAYFVQTLPGAILQIVLLPALVLALTRARLVPERYPSSGALHE